MGLGAISPSSMCLRILRRTRRGRCYTGRLFPHPGQGAGQSSLSHTFPNLLKGYTHISYFIKAPSHLCAWVLSRDRLRPYGLQHARLPCPWDSLGKNTGPNCELNPCPLQQKCGVLTTERLGMCPSLLDFNSLQ